MAHCSDIRTCPSTAFLLLVCCPPSGRGLFPGVPSGDACVTVVFGGVLCCVPGEELGESSGPGAGELGCDLCPRQKSLTFLSKSLHFSGPHFLIYETEKMIFTMSIYERVSGYKMRGRLLCSRLTWQGRHHDGQGGFPRARLIHCTPDVLSPAVSPSWGLSSA